MYDNMMLQGLHRSLRKLKMDVDGTVSEEDIESNPKRMRYALLMVSNALDYLTTLLEIPDESSPVPSHHDQTSEAFQKAMQQTKNLSGICAAARDENAPDIDLDRPIPSGMMLSRFPDERTRLNSMAGMSPGSDEDGHEEDDYEEDEDSENEEEGDGS